MVKHSFTFVRTLEVKAEECKVIKIRVQSLKDHDVPQKWNILLCLSTVNCRSHVRQRNSNIWNYSEVRI